MADKTGNRPLTVFWFRRDLRLHDNAGLYHALRSGNPVLPLFIFDKKILDKLENKRDARVLFIYQEIARIKEELEDEGSSLLVKYGKPLEIFTQLTQEYRIEAVFCNHDYEPVARERDKEIYHFLEKNHIGFMGYKDQVVFDTTEILKNNTAPYTVFTPYARKWKETVNDFYLSEYNNYRYFKNFVQTSPFPLPGLEETGFTSFSFHFPGRSIDVETVKNYHVTRDIPGIRGTTHLSVHLRFGTVSIRRVAGLARQLNDKFLTELIWRDFYQSILYHFPTTVSKAFKPEYDLVKWENNRDNFQRWCEGKTGYPLVDAGMRELNKTGYMHNRVRMVTASFLTKHLLIDWRWGEAYFAAKLLDYDQASNVGGWQWAAGCGVDAAPYFRIFNPTLQMERFDPDLKYVKSWVPEYRTSRYPAPIVDHKSARLRALDRFKKALAQR